MSELVVNKERCVGCCSCEIACAVEHSLTRSVFGTISESSPPRKRIFVTAAGGRCLPLNCRHCEDALCVQACPVGAFYRDKDEGLVLHAEELCLGCGLCQMACPFGVISRRAGSKVIVKCDRCPGLSVPACVNACPTGALVYGEAPILENLKRQELAGKLLGSGSL